jgi:Family of unknown function (DUF6884)
VSAGELSSTTLAPLALVACVTGKVGHPSRAKDLYDSAWFHKARRFVEARAWPWRILSAKHGPLDPNEVIAPYEVSLLHMAKATRLAWANAVLIALDELVVKHRAVVVLAGARCREHLVPGLEARGVRVDVPLAGMGIGKQLAWLKAHTNAPTA